MDFSAFDEVESASTKFDPSYLDHTFGVGGYLSRVMPGFTARAGQVALTRAVDRALQSNEVLLAEAGTGVGKSLGYLVPTTYYAASFQKRVVVVTANIALQEQLIGKDLPLLAKAAPWEFTYALLKGRNNFLCVSKYYKDDPDWRPPGGNVVDLETRRRLQVIREWARATVEAGKENETGDVSELPFEDGQLWSRFSATSDECRGGQCKFADDCFALHSQSLARQTNVIVTNYHMLFAHYLVQQQTAGEAYILPPFDFLVCDEAHKAGDIARDFFGWRFGRETIRRAARMVQHDSPMIEGEADKRVGTFLSMMSDLRKQSRRYQGFIDQDLEAHEVAAGKSLMEVMAQIRDMGKKRADVLFKDVPGGREANPKELSGRQLDKFEEGFDLDRMRERMDTHCKNLLELIEPWGQDGTQAFYIDENDRGTVQLASKLVHARDALRPTMFKTNAVTGKVATPTILTSATLATGRDDFSFIAYDLGVPKEHETLVAESPFDWKRQAILILPKDEDLPLPEEKSFRDAVVSALRKTIAIADGRTLGLFTSYAVMNYAYEQLFTWCKQRGIRLFKQKDMPRTKLIAEFKADARSCLFGTESFWAGVDVPGDALKVVFIDKLPFPGKDDPVLGAISRNNNDWFRDYSLPRAVIQFKQGFGRLVRSSLCYGAVICCDRRLTEKPYGKRILKSLPPVDVRTRLTDLTEWFQREPRWDD